jgi:hypothetical protein
MMRAFGSLTIRLLAPPWVKVIWGSSFVSKSLPSKGIGHSGRYKNSWVTMCPPSWHVWGQQNCGAVWVLVAPTLVALHSVSVPTDLMTKECSAPVSTVKIIGWPPTFILTVGSWGLSSKEPSLPYSDSTPARPMRSWASGSGCHPVSFPGAVLLGSDVGPLRLGHSVFQWPISLQ